MKTKKNLTLSDKFLLEKRYQAYLKRCGVTETELYPIQKVEMRRAFMGGCVEMITCFRDDIPQLPDELAMKVMDEIWNQVKQFWDNETNDY
jgi:hypothetical protein